MPTAVAQYVRMSTEHQQYSLENQSAAIRRYAEQQDFEIVRTYSDAAKTGVVLLRRQGLRQLLHDVVSGVHPFRAILVYDVSRWGRFQDTDEAAHYEFLCKSAGVPVHYCAEQFANDGSLPSLMMKALKRTMAGEFSRELGVKVLAGQKNLARLGFKQGGRPGFGLRRMLVSADHTPKQLLAHGERKSIASDRVILVPGPQSEVQVVREIYKMLLSDNLTVFGIARELNRRRIGYLEGSRWDYVAVHTVLTHPKYAGCHVFQRTTSKLYTRTVRLPTSEWVTTPGAFEAIIDQSTFDRAQEKLQTRTIKQSDEEVLRQLKVLLKAKGKLTLALIKKAPGIPSPSTYRLRFGSLRRAYELIEYRNSDEYVGCSTQRRIQALREGIIADALRLCPTVEAIRKGGRWRTRLKMRKKFTVSILIGRMVRGWKGVMRWQVEPVRHECKYVTLLALLDPTNHFSTAFYVLPGVDRIGRFSLQSEDSWLKRGMPLTSFSDLEKVADRIWAMAKARVSKRPTAS